MAMKAGSDPTRCQKKDGSLPKFIARMQCFEDANHEGECRFSMTEDEIYDFFNAIDEANNV